MGTVKPLRVSLVEPVAYPSSYVPARNMWPRSLADSISLGAARRLGHIYVISGLRVPAQTRRFHRRFVSVSAGFRKHVSMSLDTPFPASTNGSGRGLGENSALGQNTLPAR